jgi:hypothetical protein
MKMIIFALLALVAVLVLLLLRKYTRLEFVGHARLLLKTWSVRWELRRAGWCMGAVISGCCAACLGDAAAGYQKYSAANIVAMISPALVVLAILSQYVRQPKLKEKPMSSRRRNEP